MRGSLQEWVFLNILGGSLETKGDVGEMQKIEAY